VCVSVATRGALPAYQALADSIRDRILSGELEPGQRLPIEPELSTEYGVSRSTVREALRVLASQNLVSTSRGVLGGSFVAHPQPHQISDYLQSSLGLLTGTSSSEITVDTLLEARELLEVPAAGLAAFRRTGADMEILEESLVGPQPFDSAARQELSLDFHAALLRTAGNPLMEVLARPVFGVLSERFQVGDLSAAFWAEVDDDHRRIFEAVRDGDVDGAKTATRAHLAALRPAYTVPPRPRGGRRT
jgi:GntR family transcriptional repressor for pyruvate dehydrogenase complex